MISAKRNSKATIATNPAHRSDERARRKLKHFYQRIHPTFSLSPAIHSQIIDALQRVERRECKRLMVFVPPQWGKSTLISQAFPAWCLGRTPKIKIGMASYAVGLASEHSVASRDIYNGDACRQIFHLDKKAHYRKREDVTTHDTMQYWNTPDGGSYYAVGVGGGLTGRGLDIAIIDDPVKDRAEADSPTFRNRVWAWYQSTLYTRLAPDGAIVLVMTRWHRDDLAGRCLAAMADGGDQWEVIRVQAMTDKDESAWPERWTTAMLRQRRAVLDSREWASLYCQEPTESRGAIFHRDWFTENRYNYAATRDVAVSRLISWDTASEVSSTNAYSAGVAFDMSPRYQMLVRDVTHKRLEFNALMGEVIRFAEKHNWDGKLSGVLIEKASSGIALIQALRTSGPMWLRPLILDKSPKSSKTQRWYKASTWCYNGSVLLPEPGDDCPWLAGFEDELFSLPASQYVDQSDSFAQGVWYWEPQLEAGLRARGLQ